MSNAKHTPEFFRDQYGHVYAWRKTEEGKQSECILDGRTSSATSAEKNLIAAAPELLSLLEVALNGMATGAEYLVWAAEARAAIAKAKGE